MKNLESITFMVSLAAYFLSTLLYFVYMAIKKDWASKAAFYVMGAGFLIHTVSIVSRGIAAGRLPLTNQYEFASAFSWGIALVFLIFVKKFKFDALGTFVAPVIFIVIGYASMQSKDIHNLMPALQSNWLGFHVATAIIAYGAFGVAFGVALAFLLKGKVKGKVASSIPDETTLDLIIYRAVALGFLFLTLCMITGAIWANKAWGSYWSWDPKETWSLITWIIYAIFLHLRVRKGMTGRSAAIFAAVGFVCVLFTYIGVNMLLSGLHSYK